MIGEERKRVKVGGGRREEGPIGWKKRWRMMK